LKKEKEMIKVKNDFEKAQALLANRSFKLKYISESAEIPYDTVRAYSCDPQKMKTAAWKRVHKLAQIYDRLMPTGM
jgi:2-iminoacetate synthase ThiH